MRTSLVAPVLACVALLNLPATGQDRPQATFRSRTYAVLVDVSVRDARRRAVTGLEAEQFQVFDNGVLQQVGDVSYGKLPIDVTVALDVSHSVTGALLERLRQAIVQLMRDLGRQDRLKLVLFNMKVNRTTDYTTDVKAVERAIRGATAGGGTALLDALSVTLVSQSAPDRRQLVVFFTDGADSSSTTTPDMMTAVAQRTRATLTFVMPVGSSTLATFTRISPTGALPKVSPVVRQMGPVPLWPLFASLAKETGGTILPVGSSSDLSAAFKQVLDEFRSAYVLYYTPRGVDRGGYHTIEVKVRRDGAVVQARRGYFGS